jgi:hypothetical protein
MKTKIILLSLALAGCNTAPLTPEQALMLMNMQRSQQAAQAATWQAIRPAPIYVTRPVQPPPPTYQNNSIQCVTRHVAGASYTDCY